MKSSDDLDMDIKGYSERYIRWQGIRVQQVGYVNNLFTLLASGSLLWQGQTLLTTPMLVQDHVFYLLSALLFFVSVITGCYIAWNRLADFSLTANRLRSLMESPPSRTNQETRELQQNMGDEADRLGKITRSLLPIQFISFAVGFLFVAVDITVHLFGI